MSEMGMAQIIPTGETETVTIDFFLMNDLYREVQMKTRKEIKRLDRAEIIEVMGLPPVTQET